MTLKGFLLFCQTASSEKKNHSKKTRKGQYNTSDYDDDKKSRKPSET